jgi:5-methylcytosine-specific restriction endonuclease McrA
MYEYRADHVEETAAYNRQYHIDHAEEVSAYNRQWNLDHPEERAAYNRQRRVDHPEEMSAYMRQWRLDHRDEVAAYIRQWQIDNRDRVNASSAKRRARLLNAPGWDYTTDKMIAARWEMFGGLCWICGEPATETDHVKPLAKGGSHYPANLRPICDHCNSSKKDKWPYPA